MVVQGVVAQRLGAQAVVGRVRVADDGAALQIGVAADLDVEPALAREQAALLLHGDVLGVGVELAVVEAEVDRGVGADADADLDAEGLLLVAVVLLVLLADDAEVAAGVGGDPSDNSVSADGAA